MTRITGYTYEADLHCVDCTQKASHRMKLHHQHPYAMGDREGNPIHPMFSTDENPDYPLPQNCGDCNREIT